MPKKDKKYLIKIQIIVTVVCIILGIFLHFTYKISGNNWLVGSFSAVNESVWEHLKLVVFPIFIIGIIEYFFVVDKANNYIEAKAIAVIFSMFLIPIAFYTYTNLLGTDITVLDISIFIISVVLSELISYIIMTKEKKSTKITEIFFGGLLLIIIFSFIIFTYNTPKLSIFKDPINDTYGINKYKKCSKKEHFFVTNLFDYEYNSTKKNLKHERNIIASLK